MDNLPRGMPMIRWRRGAGLLPMAVRQQAGCLMQSRVPFLVSEEKFNVQGETLSAIGFRPWLRVGHLCAKSNGSAHICAVRSGNYCQAAAHWSGLWANQFFKRRKSLGFVFIGMKRVSGWFLRCKQFFFSSNLASFRWNSKIELIVRFVSGTNLCWIRRETLL